MGDGASKFDLDSEASDRFSSILNSEFVTELNAHGDFESSDRLIFSLDNASFTIVDEEMLPKLIDIFRSFMKVKLEIRICVGGYQYSHGQFSQEISFMIKMPSQKEFNSEADFNAAIYEFNQKLYNYLVHYTRQVEFPKFSGQSRLSGLTQSGGVNRGRERQRGKEKIYRRV